MIFPKISESIKNSEFFRRNDTIPNDFLLKYKKIKNDYIVSKKEIKNKLKNDLIDFIDTFIMYNIDDSFIEDYVLDLIQEFGYDDINHIIMNKKDHIINKIDVLYSIKLLKNVKIYEEEFMYEHCSPEYYIQNKNNLDKNKLKNKHMVKFFNNVDKYRLVIDSKINIGNIDINHKYFRWIEDLGELFIQAIKKENIKCAKYLLTMVLISITRMILHLSSPV